VKRLKAIFWSHACETLYIAIQKPRSRWSCRIFFLFLGVSKKEVDDCKKKGPDDWANKL